MDCLCILLRLDQRADILGLLRVPEEAVLHIRQHHVLMYAGHPARPSVWDQGCCCLGHLLNVCFDELPAFERAHVLLHLLLILTAHVKLVAFRAVAILELFLFGEHATDHALRDGLSFQEVVYLHATWVGTLALYWGRPTWIQLDFGIRSRTGTETNRPIILLLIATHLLDNISVDFILAAGGALFALLPRDDHLLPHERGVSYLWDSGALVRVCRVGVACCDGIVNQRI